MALSSNNQWQTNAWSSFDSILGRYITTRENALTFTSDKLSILNNGNYKTAKVNCCVMVSLAISITLKLCKLDDNLANMNHLYY